METLATSVCCCTLAGNSTSKIWFRNCIGESDVSSLKWRVVGPSSLVQLSRTSYSWFSVCWVRYIIIIINTFKLKQVDLTLVYSILKLDVASGTFSFMYLWRSTGTPTEETWPGIHSNEDFLSYRFDHCAPQSLIHRAPRLDGDGLDLLNKFLSVRCREKKICFWSIQPHKFFLYIFFLFCFCSCLCVSFSMKPKSGSQPRMQCATRTFDPWDRWCTKYQTVNLW